jgi:hypothetical protein
MEPWTTGILERWNNAIPAWVSRSDDSTRIIPPFHGSIIPGSSASVPIGFVSALG